MEITDVSSFELGKTPEIRIKISKADHSRQIINAEGTAKEKNVLM